MSNEVLIALLTTISALVGSVVGIIGNSIVSRINEKCKINKEVRELKLKLYSQFLMNLQNPINLSNSEHFDKISNCINEIKLVGGHEVVKAISEYYIKICDKKLELGAWHHSLLQDNIINAMRKELSMKKVKGNLGLIANKIDDEQNDDLTGV